MKPPRPAPCACKVSGPAPGTPRVVGRRNRKALAVEPKLKAANLAHLRRIEGQVRGVVRMIEDDRYCADILTQVAAIRQSLQAVAKNLLRNHLTHCAAAALASGGGPADDMLDELADLVAKVSR